MGNKIYMVLGLWGCLMVCSSVHAQSGETEREIANVLERFFLALEEKDSEALRSAFLMDASLSTVLGSDDGNFSKLQTYTVDDFVSRISNASNSLEEKLLSIDVRVDGHMATAWAPYEFFIDGDFHHCGVNSFQFIYDKDGWKITHVMDTRRTKGCE
jgi:hypothetical protein